MLVVRLELWPGGDATRARPIGQINVANDGTGFDQRGNYDAVLLHAGKFYGKPGAYKTARVEGHLRTLSPYHLLLKVLQNALGRGGAFHG